jgi:hypothetical protein
MAVRQNIGTGGLYPTGIAPQALDFTRTQEALSQALIGQTKERIKQQKDLMSESEKALIKAMDFESVQGLAEQAQLDHMKRYQDLTSRWTEEYKKGNGILSMPKQMEMMKEKRKLDIDTSNMKFRIEQVHKAQQEYNAHPLNYDPQTAVNLKNIFDNGLQGLVDASNVLVPKQVAWTEYVDNTYKHEIGALKDKLSTAISMADSRIAKTEAIKQNLKETGDLYDTALKATPNILKDSSGRTVSKDEFIKTYGTNISTESINSGLYSTDRRSSGRGKTETNLENVNYVNNILEGLIQFDERSKDAINNLSIQGGGDVVRMNFGKNDEGKDVLRITGSRKEQAKTAGGKSVNVPYTRDIVYPTDLNDAQAVHDWKLSVYKAMNLLSGKQEPVDIAGKIVPFNKSYEHSGQYFEDPDRKAAYNAVESELAKPKPKKEDLATLLNDLNIGSEANTNWFWIAGNKIEVTDNGEKTTYDLSSSKDKKALKEYVQSKREAEKAAIVKKYSKQRSDEPKPRRVEQDGIVYILNEETGEYDPE